MLAIYCEVSIHPQVFELVLLWMDSLENMYEQQPGENPGRGGGLLDVSSVSWTQDMLWSKAGNKPATVYLDMVNRLDGLDSILHYMVMRNAAS